MLLNILIFLFVLSLLIFSHEFGHFISARLSGVKVEKFAFGFGPPLLKFKWKETLLLICLIPMGGYVKLAGEERDQHKGLEDEFFSKPVGVRARIVFSGPFFNFILAFLIFWMIFIFIGFPSSKPVIGEVFKYAPVAKSEFSPHQLRLLKEKGIIEEVNSNVKYMIWKANTLEIEDLQKRGFSYLESKRIFHLWHNSIKITPKESFSPQQLKELIEKNMVTQKVVYWHLLNEEELKKKLLQPGVTNKMIEDIIAILKKSRYPAYRAGLEEGDRVLAVNGRKVNNWGEMSKLIRESKDKVVLTILREGEEKEVTVIPERITVKNISGEEKEVSVIGVGSKVVKGNIFSSLIKASQKIFYLTKTFFKSFLLLIARKVSFKKAVAGPIGIGVLTAKIAKLGLITLFDFVGILSLSLAIINLFPFPVLDGGHLFFMLIEKLRGRPIPKRWEEIINHLGLGILIALMMLVSYNDILKYSFKTSELTFQQSQLLEKKGLLGELKNDAKYVFWRYFTEDELRSKLSGLRFSNMESILSIWRNSPKGVEVVINDEERS